MEGERSMDSKVIMMNILCTIQEMFPSYVGVDLLLSNGKTRLLYWTYDCWTQSCSRTCGSASQTLVKIVCVCVCVCVRNFSRFRLCATPWTVAHQAPLSLGFSRQEYWMGSRALLQGIFPTQGSNPPLLGLLHRRQILHC